MEISTTLWNNSMNASVCFSVPSILFHGRYIRQWKLPSTPICFHLYPWKVSSTFFSFFGRMVVIASMAAASMEATIYGGAYFQFAICSPNSNTRGMVLSVFVWCRVKRVVGPIAIDHSFIILVGTYTPDGPDPMWHPAPIYRYRNIISAPQQPSESENAKRKP